MNIRYLLLLIPCLCFCCNKAKDINQDDTTYKNIMVESAVEPQEEFDSRIEDINIYAFSTYTGRKTAHLYSSDGSMNQEIKLPSGDYEIYAIANIGYDMGEEMSIKDIQNYRFSTDYRMSSIPMCGNDVFRVTKQESFNITLRRCLAKIICNIEVADSLPNMRLNSLQLRNMAYEGLLCSINHKADSVYDSEIVYNEGNPQTMTQTFYLGENCAGYNNSIKSQRDKNAENAPDQATYLLINASNGSKLCTYSVYLGSNNTTDFNIHSNTIQNLNITIAGESEVDTRLKTDKISIKDDMANPFYSSPSAGKEFCTAGNDYHLTISSSSGLDIYEAEIRLICGDKQYFSIGNAEGVDRYITEAGTLDSDFTIQIGYNPPLFTKTNNILVYDVIIRSRLGNVYTERISHEFYNELHVYTSYVGKGYPVGGTVESSFYRKYTFSDEYSMVSLLTPDEYIDLKVGLIDGFVLKGWYDALDNGTVITQNESIRYILHSNKETLLTWFRREKFYIYTNLQEVDVRCIYKIPVIVPEKNAYAVEIGALCTIKGKDESKFIKGWCDEKGNIISNSYVYDVVPTENFHIYPIYK